MNLSAWLTIIGLIFAILGHAFATVWWAAKMSATLSSILLALVRIDIEFEKRDKQILIIRDRVDAHSEMLAAHSAILKNK